MKTQEFDTLLENYTLELRRGMIILAVLSQLDEEQYGYSLIKRLADHNFEIDQGTLYPLLRRLEDKGLLQSEWNTEGSRPRRYYQISPMGMQMLSALKSEWQSMVATLQGVLG